MQRQDPTLPHTWFNLGIYYKHQGDAQRAIAQFEGMLARTPDEAIAHYQLGTLYNQTNRHQEAQAQFEKAAELDPLLAAARFQLYNLNRLAGNTAQADRYLADFERIKTSAEKLGDPGERGVVQLCRDLRPARGSRGSGGVAGTEVRRHAP